MSLSTSDVVMFHVIVAYALAGDDIALQFKVSETFSLTFPSQYLDQFHDCLCTTTNIMCSVNFVRTLPSFNNLSDSDSESYVSHYDCLIKFDYALNVTCNRQRKYHSCQERMCLEFCFVNRTHCDMQFVSMTMIHLQDVEEVKIIKPDYLKQGLCSSRGAPQLIIHWMILISITASLILGPQ